MINFMLAIVGVISLARAQATTLEFKVCDAERKVNEIKITQTQITIHRPNGNDDILMNKTSEETFKPGDLGDGEAVFLSILGIRSYTDGQVFETSSLEATSVPVMIFNYAKKHRAVLLLVEGWPLPLGKSDNCK
jgi:hypothetical protein